MSRLRVPLPHSGSRTLPLARVLVVLATPLWPSPADAKEPRGTAHAITADDNVIHACVRQTPGRLRVVHDPAECKCREEVTSSNRARPPVAVGPPVLTGIKVEPQT